MSRLPLARRPDASPTIILVPGLDGTALLFYRQIPLLAEQFHVVAFPLPDRPDSTMRSLVDDLRRLIAQIAPGPVVLCGESFGGALSLSFALTYPDSLSGLVIINSFPVIRQRLRLRLAPPLLRTMPWGAMRIVRRFTESRVHSAHAQPEDLREFHQRMKQVGKNGYIRRLEILQSYDIRARLSDIRTPALFLAAERDQLVPSVREAQFMSARMPNSTTRILQGYGHICVINHDLNLLEYIHPWYQALSEKRP